MSHDPTPPAERWYRIPAAEAERVRDLLEFVASHRHDRSKCVEARSLAGYAADALRRFDTGHQATAAVPLSPQR